MPIRGFKDHNLVACFDRRAGILEPSFENTFNIDHPQNAPAKTPADYLDLITFHSRCFQYEVAFGPTDVPITHAALAAKLNRMGVDGDGGFVPPGSGLATPSVGIEVWGDQRATDILLVNHGLGYVPKFMVALDGRRLPDGWQLQYDGSGGCRQVSAFATSSSIYLRETALSGGATLAAMSATYRVFVFRTRAPEAGVPLLGNPGGNLVLARGVINSARRYLRNGAADSPFALNIGPTLDIANGAARSASGGVVVNEPDYTGSMLAPAFRAVGV